MKTEKELEVLKCEYNSLKNKLLELSEEEIKQVVGGNEYDMFKKDKGPGGYNYNIYSISSDIEQKKIEFTKK